MTYSITSQIWDYDLEWMLSRHSRPIGYSNHFTSKPALFNNTLWPVWKICIVEGGLKIVNLNKRLSALQENQKQEKQQVEHTESKINLRSNMTYWFKVIVKEQSIKKIKSL